MATVIDLTSGSGEVTIVRFSKDLQFERSDKGVVELKNVTTGESLTVDIAQLDPRLMEQAWGIVLKMWS